MEIKTIEQRIRDKAEVAAIKDIQDFQNAICKISMANRFVVRTGNGNSMSIAYAVGRQGIETNYQDLKEQITNEYVEKYTKELMDNLKFIDEYLKEVPNGN